MGSLCVADQRSLCDLKSKKIGFCVCVSQYARNHGDEIMGHDLTRRYVYGHRQVSVGAAITHPVDTGLLEHPSSKFDDESGLLGKWDGRRRRYCSTDGMVPPE